MRPTLIGHGSGHAAAQLQASSHDGQHKRPDAWKMFLAPGNNRSGPSHLRCIEINFLLLCQSQGVMAVFKAWFTCAFLKQRAPLGKSSLAAAQPFVGLPQGQASAMMNVKTDDLILPGAAGLEDVNLRESVCRGGHSSCQPWTRRLHQGEQMHQVHGRL